MNSLELTGHPLLQETPQECLSQCLQSHKNAPEWPPTKALVLWVTPTPCGVTKREVQTSYKVGSKVTYEDKAYECIQAHPSVEGWVPPVCPALWKIVSGSTTDPEPPTEEPSQALAATFSTVGLHNQEVARLLVRPADAAALGPALRLVGLDGNAHAHATDETATGLLTEIELGQPLPQIGSLSRNLELKGLSPGNRQGVHALLHLPDGDAAAAALQFIEQLDTKGNVVGGVAMLAARPGRGKALGRATASPDAAALVRSITKDIKASIPFRPYATHRRTGLMLVDGIFDSNLGFQGIQVEVRNDDDALTRTSVYVEGFSDPNIPVPLRQMPGPTYWEKGAFSKAVFYTDFSNAATGECYVSFIVQKQQGQDTLKVRIVKKIFILGIQFDRATKTFSAATPEARLKAHIKTVVTNKRLLSSGCKDCPLQKRPCCECCSSIATSDSEAALHAPILI